MSYPTNTTLLFGPNWDTHRWTASDDRVRGGSSVSNLVPTAQGVCFHGNLDIETLGGAGFASQRTVGHEETWDLTGHDGIELNITSSDHKRYTLSLTDEVARQRSDGREQSALVWEYDFSMKKACTVRVPWKELKPTYRGKPVEDARLLDLSRVKRFRIMARSFFGEQQGKFNLEVRSIALYRESYLDDPGATKECMNYHIKGEERPEETQADRKWFPTCCLF